MRLTVLTPQKEVMKDQEIASLRVVTESRGEVTVLDNHADYVAALGTGVFTYTMKDQKVFQGALSSGFIKIHANQAFLLANTLELSDEINVARAEAAKQKAMEMLKKVTSPEEVHKYNQKLERAMARISAGINH